MTDSFICLLRQTALGAPPIRPEREAERALRANWLSWDMADVLSRIPARLRHAPRAFPLEPRHLIAPRFGLGKDQNPT